MRRKNAERKRRESKVPVFSFSELRLRRLRHRISRRAVAEYLGCSESWLSALEGGNYRGPAREVWGKRYVVALEALIAERRDCREGVGGGD